MKKTQITDDKYLNVKFAFSARTSAARLKNEYLIYNKHKLANVSFGKELCCIRNCSFSKPVLGSSSMFMTAILWSEIGSSSVSDLGGISVRASRAAIT